MPKFKKESAKPTSRVPVVEELVSVPAPIVTPPAVEPKPAPPVKEIALAPEDKITAFIRNFFAYSGVPQRPTSDAMMNLRKYVKEHIKE